VRELAELVGAALDAPRFATSARPPDTGAKRPLGRLPLAISHSVRPSSQDGSDALQADQMVMRPL
jgi:hypothetical protein